MKAKSLNEKLMSAIELHDLAGVKACLGEGADANYDRGENAVESDGVVLPATPLCLVMFCISDCLLEDADLREFGEIARVLLAHGGDPRPALELAEERYGRYDPEAEGSAFMEVWGVVAGPLADARSSSWFAFANESEKEQCATDDSTEEL
jgi:hypothetical protein